MSSTAPPLLKLIDVAKRSRDEDRMDDGCRHRGRRRWRTWRKRTRSWWYQLRSFAGVAPAWNPPEGLWRSRRHVLPPVG